MFLYLAFSRRSLALPAVRRLIPALAVLLLPALVGCGSSKSNASTTSGGSTSSSSSAATTGSAKKQGCAPVQKPAPHSGGGQSKPRGKLNPHKTYTVTVE